MNRTSFALGTRNDMPMIARSARVIGLLSAVAALALAGCGGGGGSSTTSSGPTRAQYIASANAICGAVRKQAAPLIAKVKGSVASLITGGASVAKTVAGELAQLHIVAGAGLAKLRALQQPAADHATIAHFLTPLTTVIADIGQAAATLAKDEPLNALALLQQAQPAAAQLTGAAKAFGAKQCGAVLSAL